MRIKRACLPKYFRPEMETGAVDDVTQICLEGLDSPQAKEAAIKKAIIQYGCDDELLNSFARFIGYEGNMKNILVPVCAEN